MSTKPIELPVELEDLGNGRVLVYTDAMQGCLAEGDSVEDALENVEDVARVLLELTEEFGDPVPRGMNGYRERGFKATVQAQPA